MTKLLLPLLLIFGLATPAIAQQSEMFDQYELHYSVVNTTFLAPEVAAAYGITRGDDRAILNLAVREHLSEGGTEARSMELKGRTWDLLQHTQQLEFLEVREGEAFYSIAEFKFLNEEWRHFEVHFRPKGGDKTHTFKLRHQMYEE
jgi:RNA-binding protein YlmH